MCTVAKCPERHILCIWTEESKVPVSGWLYLKDQRMKSGARGSYQIGTVDRSAPIKQHKFKSQRESGGNATEPMGTDMDLSGSDYNEKVGIFMVHVVIYIY